MTLPSQTVYNVRHQSFDRLEKIFQLTVDVQSVLRFLMQEQEVKFDANRAVVLEMTNTRVKTRIAVVTCRLEVEDCIDQSNQFHTSGLAFSGESYCVYLLTGQVDRIENVTGVRFEDVSGINCAHRRQPLTSLQSYYLCRAKLCVIAQLKYLLRQVQAMKCKGNHVKNYEVSCRIQDRGYRRRPDENDTRLFLLRFLSHYKDYSKFSSIIRVNYLLIHASVFSKVKCVGFMRMSSTMNEFEQYAISNEIVIFSFESLCY